MVCFAAGCGPGVFCKAAVVVLLAGVMGLLLVEGLVVLSRCVGCGDGCGCVWCSGGECCRGNCDFGGFVVMWSRSRFQELC